MTGNPVGEVADAPELPGWTHHYSGKVRDLYLPEITADGAGAQVLLVVASDRISAYDHILSTPIPDKGAVLTALTTWWLTQLGDLVPTHLLDAEDVAAASGVPAVPAQVAGRAMVVRSLEMVPVECVARGYLAGSGLTEYQDGGQVCGVRLPAGLVEASRLPEPIFTPAAKAPLGEHDENIDFAEVVARVGDDVAQQLRELTLRLYSRAEAVARERGVILADTKFEFGIDFGPEPAPGPDGSSAPYELVLGDEVLTPDSSRFWPAEEWQPGRVQPSFDKQFVRDWLTSPASGWDRYGDAPPPPLPEDVVERTRERYLAAYKRLTGTDWS